MYKKCKESAASGDIMGACKVMLELMEARKVEVEKEGDQTYLEVALKIRESGEIEDPELKNTASILIMAIEMS